ncbi:hypothetical protein [Kitasatospora sp. NPDC058190]|uniref:hypothetical protein n=1 Tax=Kitasatospora sp. NPDC058190 TaxID=3346371 RepID=UPI0036DEE8E0
MTTARTRRWSARAAAVLVAVVVAGTAMPAAEARPPKGETARVSEGSKGEQLDAGSSALGLSDDGRYALFSSAATNLLPQEGTPNTDEIYVRDLRNGHVERVSVADDGSRLNALTSEASISGDGRYVAFSTTATNVVPDQPKHRSDIYVRDLWTGSTELVTEGGLPSTDDQSGRDAMSPSISGDGRYVAYVSDRTDLAPGTGNRGEKNIYVTDRWTRTTRLVSVGLNGRPGNRASYLPTISADGSTIGFGSMAGNLLSAAPAGSTTPADSTDAGPAADPGPADDPGTADDPGAAADTGSAPEAGSARLAPLPHYHPYYVWKADTGRITVGSLDDAGRTAGARPDARISPDGRYAVYSLASHGTGVPGHGDTQMNVYVQELATGKVTRVSTSLPGTTPNGSSSGGVMTADDHWVYFESAADNLVPGDTNQVTDVFRRDLSTGTIERVSLTRDGEQSNTTAYGPYVDAAGDTAIFTAQDGNLVPGDTGLQWDVFLRRL